MTAVDRAVLRIEALRSLEASLAVTHSGGGYQYVEADPEHLRFVLDALDAAEQQRNHYKRAAVTIESENHDILAKALGYPEYEPGEPGYSPDRVNYVTGDHVSQSLAMEAAGRIAAAEQTIADALAAYPVDAPVVDVRWAHMARILEGSK